MPKKKAQYRFSDETLRKIERLAKKLDMSKTEVLREAIRRLADKENVR